MAIGTRTFVFLATYLVLGLFVLFGGPSLAQESAASATPPPHEEAATATPDSSGRETVSTERPLFDLMFTDTDGSQLDWPQFRRLFDANAMMTNDQALAGRRHAKVLAECTSLGRLLQDYSLRSSDYNERAAKKDLRRRLLVFQPGDSTDASLRTGDYDRVGDYAVIREEPHSTYKAPGGKNPGSDLDILKVYLLVDRIFKNGDLPPSLMPQLLYDIGGHFFANVEYYVNTDRNTKIDKADKKEVKKAAQKLMQIVVDDIKAKKAPPLVTEKQSYFEDLAKKD